MPLNWLDKQQSGGLVLFSSHSMEQDPQLKTGLLIHYTKVETQVISIRIRKQANKQGIYQNSGKP